MPDTERQIVGFDDIHLKVGERLQMQTLGTADRTHYAVRYLGALKDVSLLTTIPTIDNDSMWMRPGGEYIFRLLAGSHVYAFNAQVVKARTHPYPYAHFTYPKDVQARKVRHSPRIELHLASQAVRANGSTLPLTFLDISLYGALVEAGGALGDAGESVLVALPIYLTEFKHKLALRATIRNVSAGERPRYGLEFAALADADAMLLHFFVDHLIAEGVGGGV